MSALLVPRNFPPLPCFWVLLCRYAERIPTKPILLLTNDAGSRAECKAMGVDAMHLSTYARSRTDVPDLMDLVARTEMTGDEEEEEARRLLGKRVGVWWQ